MHLISDFFKQRLHILSIIGCNLFKCVRVSSYFKIKLGYLHQYYFKYFNNMKRHINYQPFIDRWSGI